MKLRKMAKIRGNGAFFIRVIAGLALAGFLGAGAWAGAQAPAQQPKQQQPAQKPAESNPFPEDTNGVPVLPSGVAPPAPAMSSAAPGAASGSASSLPPGDVDPVRSPDEPLPDMSSSSGESSSSSTDLANILAPPPDDESRKQRKGKGIEPPEHQETAAEDESVGGYYLEQKNWKGALSRYQSALVLDPENPDVYWGLAESQRHLGDIANAKANYKKVMEYDPDSKHGKEAKKLLKDPEMAGVK